jgi:hypothetical protein
MNIVVADQPSAGNGTSDETGKSNSSAGSDAYYHDSFVDQIDSMLQLQKQREEQLRKDYIKE